MRAVTRTLIEGVGKFSLSPNSGRSCYSSENLGVATMQSQQGGLWKTLGEMRLAASSLSFIILKKSGKRGKYLRGSEILQKLSIYLKVTLKRFYQTEFTESLEF